MSRSVDWNSNIDKRACSDRRPDSTRHRASEKQPMAGWCQRRQEAQHNVTSRRTTTRFQDLRYAGRSGSEPLAARTRARARLTRSGRDRGSTRSQEQQLKARREHECSRRTPSASSDRGPVWAQQDDAPGTQEQKQLSDFQASGQRASRGGVWM